LYQYLARELTGVDWEKVHIFLVDERWVEVTHRESNFGMIKETLLQHIPIPEANIHAIPILKTLEFSAKAYARDLRQFFQLDECKNPGFDLIMLGMGTDGHTASLFAGDPALAVKDRWVCAISKASVSYERISLTLPALNAARNVIFYVAGTNKAPVVQSVIEGKDPGLPAGKVHPTEGTLSFVLDRAATVCLKDTEEYS